MLNTCLTVRAHTAGSHQGKGWEQFTDRVIEVVDRYGGANLGEKSGFGRGVVFLAWGAWAAKRVAKLSKVSRSFSANLTEGLVPLGPLSPLPSSFFASTPFFFFPCSLLDVDDVSFSARVDLLPQQTKHLILSSAVSGVPSCLCTTATARTDDRSARSTFLAPFPTEREQGILRQWALPKSERLAGSTIRPRWEGGLVYARPRHLTHACHSHTTDSGSACFGYRRAAIVPGSLLLNAFGLALCKAYINGDIQTRN
jgi:hypothetical protein